MRTRIEHVTLLTMNTQMDVFFDASLTFEDDRILGINLVGEVDVCIDGKQGILMPGFINTHTHLPMIPFRSLEDDRPDRLRQFLFPLETTAMDANLISLSARYGALESLLCGVTSVLDMYYFPDVCATAYDEVGLRALVGATIIDQATPDALNEQDGFDKGLAFIKRWKDHPRIQGILAPHGTHTVSEEMLKKIASYAQATKILTTVHASEMVYEMDYFKEHRHATPIEFLHAIGFLQENTILAHAIFAQSQDITLIKQQNAKVAHCIGANTKAAKGVAPIAQMMDAGIIVGLGTDGPASGNTLDLFVQMNLAAKIHKVYNQDRSRFKAQELVALATIEGAKVLGLEAEIGSLEVGKKADLVLIETDSVNMFPIHDPYAALVYSANASQVDSVWVDGHCLVKHKTLVNEDLATVKKALNVAMTKFNQEAKRIQASLVKI